MSDERLFRSTRGGVRVEREPVNECKIGSPHRLPASYHTEALDKSLPARLPYS
jgi:hypothetical protein